MLPPAAGSTFFQECQLCLWRATSSVCLLFSYDTKLLIWDDTRWCKSWASSTHLQISRGARPPHVREQVRVFCNLVNINAVLLPVRQTTPYEGLERKRIIFSHVYYLKCFYMDFYGEHTFASLLATGLTGNWTSVAFNMVFSCRMSCCDWLWPKGWKRTSNA